MKIKKWLYIAAVLWAIVLYLMTLPAINIQSLGFWTYAIMVYIPFAAISYNYKLNPIQFIKQGKNITLTVICLVLVAIYFLGTIIGTPYLGGLKSYRDRIQISEKSDINRLDEFDPTQVQIIDKDISVSLADRVFGEMGAEIVSQYQISNNYASVVVNNTMYRLTPVEYSTFIKWLSTNNTGTPGYISVNVTDGETIFHDLDEGLKYTFNAYFLNNMEYHLRLKYPTFIFGQTKFEVDDNWKPYWISEVMKYSFVGKAEDVKGVVITDPTTGESDYYDVKDVPKWVDNVYNANLICQQYNSYGSLKNGLFNFSQKGITTTTDDYAYLQKDGHLWIYTGITSVGNDESNVGFIYADMRDKEIIYIESAGAEEYSARASAEGAVQEKGYRTVFPTMVKIENEPVYFMGLKDNAGLVKAYAFVSYKNYQKVGIGQTVSEALKNYTGKNVISIDKLVEKTITINDIQTAVVNGYTIYFIQTTENEYYKCSIEISDKLPFIQMSDILTVKLNENEIVEIK